MKNAFAKLKRVLSLVMVFAIVLTLVPFTASAANPETLYLTPNSNWTQASARFAAYFFGDSGETWAGMTDTDGDGIYEVTVPAGSWSNVIFCRMNPGSSTNDWNSKWNKTGDLVLSNANVHFAVPSGAWDGSTAGWSEYVYTVAGAAGLCGQEWTPASTANALKQNSNGIWEKTYADVAAGTYEFKVTNGTWDQAWPGSNASVTVEKDGSAVTVFFNAGTEEITTEVVAPIVEYSVTFNGTNVTSSNTQTKVEEGRDYITTLTPDEGYVLPETVEVTVGGSPVTPDYDQTTGQLTVSAVTGDVVITAVAQEEDDGMITVYFRNDWLWPSVQLHYWGSGIAGDTSWPGINMEKVDTVSTSDGDRDVYMAEIPGDVDGFLFSGTEKGNASNRQQTPDITGFADGDAYYIHWDGANKVNKFEYPPADDGGEDDGEGGEASTEYYLVGYLNNADYTGTDYKFEDGKLEVTFTADSYVYIRTGSGDNYMFSAYCQDTTGILSTSGNEKMFVPGNTELVFTLEENQDGTLQLSYETAQQEGVEVEYTATFHFADQKGWGSVNLYSWLDSGTVTAGWPGDAMPKGSDGFHSLPLTYTAPASTDLNVIFNGGGTQTVDLKVPFSAFTDNKVEKWVELTTQTDGKWNAAFYDSGDAIAVSPIVDGDTVTFQYKAPNATSVDVRGTMLGSDGWNNARMMTKNEYGIWSVTVTDVQPGIHQYKFVVDEQWTADPLNSWTVDGNSAFQVLNPDAEDVNKITVNVYYDRADGIYETAVDGEDAVWNAYVWGDGITAGGYYFEEDSQGRMVTSIVIEDGRSAKSLALKTRLSSDTKDWVREESQVSVDLTEVVSGTINVFVTSDGQDGLAGTVTSTQEYEMDVVKANKITDLQYDYDSKTVSLTTLEALTDPMAELKLVNTEDETDTTAIQAVASSGGVYTLTLTAQPDLVNLYKYQILFENYYYAIGIDSVYASEAFDEEFTYDGELGALYTASGTEFRLWAPTAEQVSLNLYESGTKDTNDLIESIPMTRGDKGVWSVKADGDQNGVYYTYSVLVNGQTVEAIDPYARTAGVNGDRGMVIDMDSVTPDDGTMNEISEKPENYTDAIIYELHVRDFSIDDSSGVKDEWQGKFLGLTQTGTTTEGGSTTGLDYLTDLGITHLHLLPIYDYASVKEDKLDVAQFNWGYDPQNYNVPEGSYSTDPYNGEVRVQEMKQMVDVLHENEIGVIMDVVYNHVYDADTFSFNQIVPGYFSRVDSNTSGCGNDTASEREMVRKFIVDSVVYWAQAYNIDGFRFDLVGLLDVETINQIVEAVHAVRPDVIFYGEGWDMDGTNKEPGTEMAKQGNASKTPGFAYFSDGIRNDLGGNNGHSKGFASGESGKEGAIASHIQAQPWWTSEPNQIIQYASCHDNYTLADKIILSTGASGLNSTVVKMSNLAAATYMTAQGIPFIHAGEELLREKLYDNGKREENSYNKGDAVNHIQWSNLDSTEIDYAANAAYYKGLIAFRKAHPALRYATSEEVAANVQIRESANKIVSYRIDGEGAKAAGETHDILVILNANAASKSVTLPAGEWTVNAKDGKAGTESLGTAEGSVTVAGYSAMILTKENEGVDEEEPLGASEEKSIYFSNNKSWNQVYAYAFTDGGETILLGAWPGTQATKVGTNEYGEDIYEIKLPASETGIEGVVINNGGNGQQTVDIEPGVDGTGYYCTEQTESGKWLVNTYTYRAPVLGGEDEYFLTGWINGTDFTGTDYKLDENGQLTVTFDEDSYVYVVNGTGTQEYMTDGWLGSVTSATLYNTQDPNNSPSQDVTEPGWNKLMIPGGVEVIITLVKNADGTVTLSYVTAADAVVDATGIQDGLTLHCWNWSFAEIEANMDQIAAQGYTAIQTSPVQPLKETTGSSAVGTHWWVYYQPVDFKINTAEGNALGTKSELVSMIETAHSYGVKVIVDVVANHLANQTGNDLSDKIPQYLLVDDYWHDITVNTNNWNDRFEVTQYCMSGLPDLNTANEELQGYVLDFLTECVDAGVDGFRFDAAKSIETPMDNADFASDFWPTVIGGAEAYAQQTYGKDLYMYGEVLDTTGGVGLIAYTQYMAITDNSWGNSLRNSIANDQAALASGYNKAADPSVLVLWAESHDTYATDDAGQSSAGISEEDILKTWALVAGRKDAMGLYFARPESNSQLLGVASVTAWAEDSVAQINKFHNAFAGQEEAVSNEGGISYIERGISGAVLVKADDSVSSTVSVSAKAMADGTYTDQISGNTFTVADGKISGTIGDSGVAVVYAPALYDVTVEDGQEGTVTTDVEQAAEGDKVTVTVTAPEGKTVDTVTVTTQTGEEISVTDNGDGTYSFLQPAGPVTVSVTYKAITYRVTWVDEDGNEVASVTVEHGQGVPGEDVPAVPEKEGYTGAWEDVDLTRITGDITVKPVYTKIQVQPSDPTDPEPSDPTDPEPSDPTDPEPSDPTNPEPSDPTDPEPGDPTDPDPSDPTVPDPTDPEPTDPEEPKIYRIIKGDGSSVTHGSDSDITMTADGEFQKFLGIRVDGKAVDAKHYTAKSGSTVITLKASWLKTLKAGKHTLTVLFTDGQAEGTFYLKDQTDPNVPSTGDSRQPLLWITVMSASTLALAAALLLKRKKWA